MPAAGKAGQTDGGAAFVAWESARGGGGSPKSLYQEGEHDKDLRVIGPRLGTGGTPMPPVPGGKERHLPPPRPRHTRAPSLRLFTLVSH